MSISKQIHYSVLDLASVNQDSTITETFAKSVSLAQHAEEWGYTRFWLAEHHNMEGVASSATAVLIGHIAGSTQRIRVGSGGVMLPNHTPLIVAEQFGTLASLYPHRIDLGLGRAPGTDQLTASEIRGERSHNVLHFPQDVLKLMQYLGDPRPTAKVRAFPGEGTHVPVWILGSSTESARLAAAFGLPYAFASHFAPSQFFEAIEIYRANFRPSDYLKQPYLISCVNVIAAETDEEATFLASSMKLVFKGIITNQRQLLQAPVADIDLKMTESEQAAIAQMLSLSFIAGRKRLKTELVDFITQSKVDEIMVSGHLFEHSNRLKSYQIFAEVMNDVNQ